MSLKPLALAFCGLLALSVIACRELEEAASKEAEKALWPQNVLAAEVRLPETGQAATWKLSRLLERAASVPGVEQVAVVDVLPGAVASGHQVQIERDGAPSDMRQAGYVQAVSPGHFATMGLHLFRGRVFSIGDGQSGIPVAVVNESYARQTGSPGDVDVIGRRVRLGGSSELWRTIVGVVQDEPRALHTLEVYVPYTQQALYGPHGSGSKPAATPVWYLLARVPRDQEAVSAHLRQVLGLEFRPMEERLEAYRKAHEPD
ncbi:MAG: putative transport system permease protein [Acidobacteriota bacterium]|nr:putative transport system permease protein [Acidobacteriota bacterium]